MSRILKNIKNLNVTTNEYNHKYVLQRIIDKLFENDELLNNFYKSIFGEFLIYEYDKNRSYKYNQLVWYKFKDEPIIKKDDGTYLTNLHILRCNKTTINANSLTYYENNLLEDKSNSTYLFNLIGWTDLNPDIDILTEYGINKRLESYITRIFKQHTDNEVYHKYGKISYDQKNSTYIGNKVAINDFSDKNLYLNPNREYNFFPYETFQLNKYENDSILNGFGRWYDNGLLEYDIIFRLSYIGYLETDSEYKISSDVLSCNTLDFTGDQTINNYFNSELDKNIFQIINKNEENNSQIGETIQTNRNNYVNVYHANINFAQNNYLHQYQNNDYMIFQSNITLQDRDVKYNSLNISPNTLIFTKKTTESFIAILITYPNQLNYNNSNYNIKNGGLMSNSFHCHLIGKGRIKT